MEFSIKALSPETARAGCIVVGIHPGRELTPPARRVAAPPETTRPAPQAGAAASLFGGHSGARDSNFQLKGVVMASNRDESVAIIAANGKPPRAIRANGEVSPGVTVKEVQKHYILLIESGVVKKIELPEIAKRK